MRNIDRLREMSVPEMAAYLSTFGTCHVCAFGGNGVKSCLQIKKLEDIPDCEEGLAKYLEAEAD